MIFFSVLRFSRKPNRGGGEEKDLAVRDDATALADGGGGEEDLLSDHGVVLVVGVVGVAELPIWPELELQELVPELPLVPYVVPQIELSIVFFHSSCHSLSLSLSEPKFLRLRSAD